MIWPHALAMAGKRHTRAEVGMDLCVSLVDLNGETPQTKWLQPCNCLSHAGVSNLLL